MESHGDFNRKEVVAIIPARYSSERLPGKLLLEAGGKPIVVHTMERARSASLISRTIVAVDDPRLFEAVVAAGGEAVMTSGGHRSGSDRVAEVAEGLEGEPIIVNVQGDEPLISPEAIDVAVTAILEDPLVEIATTWQPIIDPDEVLSPDVVKVVIDSDGYALYFSRSPVPFPREEVARSGGLKAALEDDPALLKSFKKHTGIYVFHRESLLRFTELEATELERSEKLEQLRALENGSLIKVVEAPGSSVGIDTAEDLAKFREMLEGIST